jgi:hypothetical protein
VSISNASSHTLTVFMTLAMLAGCSAGSSQITATRGGQIPDAATQSVQHLLPGSRISRIQAMLRGAVARHLVTTPSFMDPESVTKPLVFLLDYASGTVNVYLQKDKNKMVGQIASPGGSGIATDSSRNLYVANSTASYVDNILVYAPPYTGSPMLTLDDTGYFPFAAAISPEGVVGVLNYCNSPSCNPSTANVVFYAKNATTPCAMVADPTNFGYLESSGFDKRGTLFIDGMTSSGQSTIGEVRGGCKAKKIALLTMANPVKVPGGIHVDKADRIAIFVPIPGHRAEPDRLRRRFDSGSNQPAIYTYLHPKLHSLGNSISTTPLMGAALGCVDEFAFLASGAKLYLADFCDGVASEYDYPAGGAAEKTITVEANEPASVAVTPPLVP